MTRKLMLWTLTALLTVMPMASAQAMGLDAESSPTAVAWSWLEAAGGWVASWLPGTVASNSGAGELGDGMEPHGLPDSEPGGELGDGMEPVGMPEGSEPPDPDTGELGDSMEPCG